MKEFWIDFSGYLKVKAENADEAERKFWDAVNNNCPFSIYQGFSDDVWDLDAIEEVVDFSSAINNSNIPNLQDIEDFWNDK